MVPGVAAHVRQRGVDGERCFEDDADRLVYLCVLGEALAKTRCALHAYCLMTNHVHLLVTPPEEPACSQLMYLLGHGYVPYYNRRHGRTGTLWEGRFRSCLVESREYVLACYRYIERNPVRAGMVRVASAHPWSSHSGNTGRRDDPLINPHVEYLALATDAVSRRAAYESFCDDEESLEFVPAIRHATNSGIPLIGEPLKLQLACKGIRVERGKPGRPGAQPASLEAAAELPL